MPSFLARIPINRRINIDNLSKDTIKLNGIVTLPMNDRLKAIIDLSQFDSYHSIISGLITALKQRVRFDTKANAMAYFEHRFLRSDEYGDFISFDIDWVPAILTYELLYGDYESGADPDVNNIVVEVENGIVKLSLE